MINTSKPSTSFSNTSKVASGETWNSITTTWDSETRTWDQLGSFVSNTSKINSIIDSYDETNSNNTQALRATGIAARTKIAQSFTAKQGILYSSKFYVSKTTLAPPGSCYAEIYEHSGTYGTSSVPTGTALATSALFANTGLTTSLALIELTFLGVNCITLIQDRKYCIALCYTDASGDTTHAINAGIDTSSPTHGGNESLYNPSTSTWSATASQDTIFYVYGSQSGMTNTSKPS